MRSWNLIIATSLIVPMAVLTAACAEKDGNGASTPAAVSQDLPTGEQFGNGPSTQIPIPTPLPSQAPTPDTSRFELPPPQAAQPSNGMTLGDLMGMAGSQSFPVVEHSEKVAQAVYELRALEAQLYASHQDDGDDDDDDDDYYTIPSCNCGVLLTPAEIEQLNTARFKIDAAHSDLAKVAADQVLLVQHTYYQLLTHRATLRGTSSKQAFLEQLVQVVRVLVAAGEAPPSWLDMVEASRLENVSTQASAAGQAAQLAATLLQLTAQLPGLQQPAIADIPLPDLNGATPPALPGAADAAIARSFTIHGILARREGARATIRGQTWLLSVSQTTAEQLQRIHELAVAQSKEAQMTVELGQADANLRQSIAQAQTGIAASIDRYSSIDPALMALESAFVAARVQLETGELELFELLTLVDRIIDARILKDRIAIDVLTYQAELDRALVSGMYGVIRLLEEGA